MTKTEKKIMGRLAASTTGTVSVGSGGGRGAKDGRIAYGARERAAVVSLVAAGLVEVTATRRDRYTSNARTVVHTDLVIRAR
jgi:hypothetical protein